MKKQLFSWLFLISLLLASVALSQSAAAYDDSLWRVIDAAGEMTSEEKSDLESKSEKFRNDYYMDCVVMLVDTLDGKTARDYADDTYDSGGFGMGSDNSGILILISIGDREVYISTCGAAISAINDYEIELILDDMMDALGDGDWHRAFEDGISSSGRMIERQNSSHDVSYDEDDSLGAGERLLAVFLVPAVVAGIAVGAMAYMTNNARGKFAAADYAVRGSFNLTGALDIFLSRSVTKTPRAQENSGGGHGGSSHSSSSGVSHGGGGRHF